MAIDVARFLEDLTAYRARSYIEAIQQMIVTMARADFDGMGKARKRLQEVLADTLGTAEVLGATLTLRMAGKLIAQQRKASLGRERERLVSFAEQPAQTILPNVTFTEAVQDMIDRAPVTIRRAAERTAERISQLYSEGRVVAFVRSAEQSVTERVQSLIAEAIREGIPEATTGRLIRMGVDEIRKRTEAWTEGYARMAFRTNVNTAVTAGRFRQAQDEDIQGVIPAFRFQAVGDDDTRPNHQAANGLIFTVENRVWSRISPPLGYNCRCGVAYMSRPALKRMQRIRSDGSVIEDDLPRNAFPDPGFRHGGRPDLFLDGTV